MAGARIAPIGGTAGVTGIGGTALRIGDFAQPPFATAFHYLQREEQRLIAIVPAHLAHR